MITRVSRAHNRQEKEVLGKRQDLSEMAQNVAGATTGEIKR